MQHFTYKKFTIFLIIVGILIGLDQITKIWVLQSISYGHTITVIPSFFSLTYVRNYGIAFGMGNNPSYWLNRYTLVTIPILAFLTIAYLVWRLKEEKKWYVVGLSLVAGGAVGNLIDRIRLGFVVDFLDFHFKEVYHWHTFNVADSAVVVGVCILFVVSTVQDKRKPS